jgi:hypothetical protein
MQSEIDSFIFKFRNLTHSGRDANLTFVSKAGKVSVKLDVDLGSFPVPPRYHHQPSPQIPRTRNGASYQRRLLKRAEARIKAAEEASKEISVEEAEILAVAEEAFVQANNGVEETAGEAPLRHNDVIAKPLEDEVCPDKEYNESIVTAESAVDHAEAARDRIVKKVLISPVTEPNEKKESVEKEILAKFEAIGVTVENMKSRSTLRGEFKGSIIEISPVNLNKIWGRRLGLKNCSLISYDV